MSSEDHAVRAYRTPALLHVQDSPRLLATVFGRQTRSTRCTPARRRGESSDACGPPNPRAPPKAMRIQRPPGHWRTPRQAAWFTRRRSSRPSEGVLPGALPTGDRQSAEQYRRRLPVHTPVQDRGQPPTAEAQPTPEPSEQLGTASVNARAPTTVATTTGFGTVPEVGTPTTSARCRRTVHERTRTQTQSVEHAPQH